LRGYQNPLFLDMPKSHVVVERLCAALLKLNDPSKQILSNWWARCVLLSPLSPINEAIGSPAAC
jgi:hypothetical protein